MSFDRVAPFYRALETVRFGNALQRARLRWLRQISRPRRVLIAGEGNGRFLLELIRLYPQMEIECVEESGAMLKLAKRRTQNETSGGAVRFRHQNIFEWEPSGSFDLIVSHFFLDCFGAQEIEDVVQKLAHAAGPGATWLLADFTLPSVGWANLWTRMWLGVMYAFFRLSAGLRARGLIDPTPFLRRHGFVLHARDLARGGMLKSEWWVKT